MGFLTGLRTRLEMMWNSTAVPHLSWYADIVLDLCHLGTFSGIFGFDDMLSYLEFARRTILAVRVCATRQLVPNIFLGSVLPQIALVSVLEGPLSDDCSTFAALVGTPGDFQRIHIWELFWE